jgi:hypothetical protein
VTDNLDAVLRALNAERYGPSLWWATPPPVQGSAVLLERRRMLLQMAEEADAADVGEVVA